MDYEKKYKEALERARAKYAMKDQPIHQDLVDLFPELKESKDYMMMNQLHSWMKEFGGAEEYTEKVYNWLQGLIEKQGEQKPTYITNKLKEDYQRGWDAAMQQLPKEVDSQIWQIANNSAKTWEESFAILCASQKAYDKGKKDALKEQNSTWKPSDKQIEALDFAADCIVPAEFCFKRKELKGLLEQLKKLREE